MAIVGEVPGLVAGAFGVVGVREARPGTVVVLGSRNAGFDTRGGPPAGRVFRDFTHLGAA